MAEAKIFPKGTPVRVQCSTGRTADNLVWEDLGDVVMVCGKEQFARLVAGYPAPMPIGFKREDVTTRPLAA